MMNSTRRNKQEHPRERGIYAVALTAARYRAEGRRNKIKTEGKRWQWNKRPEGEEILKMMKKWVRFGVKEGRRVKTTSICLLSEQIVLYHFIRWKKTHKSHENTALHMQKHTFYCIFRPLAKGSERESFSRCCFVRYNYSSWLFLHPVWSAELKCLFWKTWMIMIILDFVSKLTVTPYSTCL